MRVFRVFGLLLFACSLAFGSIKIASYNVNNLFDSKDDGTEYSDFKKGGKKKWGKDKYERKIAAVARDIKKIDADVILLLEIENEGVLKELARLCGYEYSVFANGNKEAPVGLGFLSKRAFEAKKSHEVSGVKTRPILQISVMDSGKRLNLFGAHFPAMKNDYSKRVKAAKAMMRAIKGVKNVIILGDLNSNYGSNFLLNDLSGDFVNIWEQKTDRKSYKGGGQIDHIMVDKDLAKGARLKFWVHDDLKSSDHNALSVSF